MKKKLHFIPYSKVSFDRLQFFRIWGTLSFDHHQVSKFFISYQKNYYRTIPIFPLYKRTLRLSPLGKYQHNKLCEEFKRFLPNHTLKDLRHTFTTRARECGIDNELVAVWTGHSLGNITSSVYTHFSIEFQQEQAKIQNISNKKLYG